MKSEIKSSNNYLVVQIFPDNRSLGGVAGTHQHQLPGGDHTLQAGQTGSKLNQIGIKSEESGTIKVSCTQTY